MHFAIASESNAALVESQGRALLARPAAATAQRRSNKWTLHYTGAGETRGYSDVTVIGTGISWTNSTWNWSVGCDKVSAGCDHCYAEALVQRMPSFGHAFSDVRLHLDRLSHVRRFKPIRQPDGSLAPHLVFVNSMSDAFHDAISDAVLARVFDVMEANPSAIFQILTKRPIRARKMLTARYTKGIPAHIWIGVSAEDNRVRKRLDILRTIKERAGGGTFFVSVEPIVGPTHSLDFTGLDWIILGGESGPRARVMERGWLEAALIGARRANAAVWLKQHGTVRSHPNLDRAPVQYSLTARFQWLRDNGWELLPQEKGGATIDKHTYRELPPAFARLKDTLNGLQLHMENDNAKQEGERR